jgi:predicted O-methyltransferase YrrM
MLLPDFEVVLNEIEEQAPERKWPIIGPERGKVLIDVIHEHKPKRILELGALVGYSSILMAANLDDDGEMVSIEIGPDNAHAARENQRRAGLADRCKVVEGDALQMIEAQAGSWDMLFIDAVKEDYLKYLKLAEPRLSSKAVVVADNVKRFAEAVQPYLDYVRNSVDYESTYHEVGDDAVEVSVRRRA